MSTTTESPQLLRDLGEGLVMRQARPDDTEALVRLNAQIHGQPNSPDEGIGVWTAELMSGQHPTFPLTDFIVVEDTRTGALVSTLNLISQQWRYGSIPFKVGRPELVATLPEYRRRGLVRQQMEVVHQWSAARGELVQAITGIPWYYRQFGYEMAVNLQGGRSGSKGDLPALPAGQEEPFKLRPATPDDAAFIQRVYEYGAQRSLLSSVRDEAMWRYEIAGRPSNSIMRFEFLIITDPAGEAVGYLVHSPILWGTGIWATAYELVPGASWLAVSPSVMRYLWATGERFAARDGKGASVNGFAFGLGTHHPLFDLFSERLPRVFDPYAWYIRVPDLPAFIRHISPVLEARLAAGAPGHTGILKLGFYRSGLKLDFQQGRLAEVTTWRPATGDFGDATFPELTFLQLLFGYRTFVELEYAYADCSAENPEIRAFVNMLFPKQSSVVWPIG